MTDDRHSRKLQRRANRVAAMQFIYALDINPPEVLRDSLRVFFEGQEEPREYYQFAEELVNGVVAHLPEIDAEIRLHAENWKFERIAKVDLAILRLAIHEMLHRPDIPPIVSIDEAIELSKGFSSDDSKRFINGILDRLKAGLHRPLREAQS